MKRVLDELVEAVGVGEYFFAEYFGPEARPGVHELAADAIQDVVVDAMFSWRLGVRDNFRSAVALAREGHHELLATQLEAIFDDVVRDDVEAIRAYEAAPNTTIPGPDYSTVAGLQRRRAKIRLVLKALASTLEAT